MQSDRPDLLPSMPPLAGTSSEFEASDMPDSSVPPVRYLHIHSALNFSKFLAVFFFLVHVYIVLFCVGQ